MYRLPFQQLMLLDILLSMLHRYRLESHILTVFNFIKSRVGLNFLSTNHTIALWWRLSTNASGYIVPRRCGKSTFSCALIAISLVFAPVAGLKALYTAQREDLCKTSFSFVLSNLNLLIAECNNVYLHKYSSDHNIETALLMQARAKIQSKQNNISVSFLLENKEGNRICRQQRICY